MQFLDLERYLFPDDVCNFTRFHGVTVDGHHHASVDPEDDVRDAGETIEEDRMEPPPALTVSIQPKKVRFAIDEEPVTTTVEEKPIIRKKKKRNMRQFIIQKSMETQNHRDDRSSSSSSSIAHNPSSPKSRRVPSSPLSIRNSKSGRRRRKFPFVSAIFA